MAGAINCLTTSLKKKEKAVTIGLLQVQAVAGDLGSRGMTSWAWIREESSLAFVGSAILRDWSSISLPDWHLLNQAMTR